MVSASHNPAEDNGLKVLDARRAEARRRRSRTSSRQLIWRAEELPGVAQRGASGGSSDARGPRWSATVAHRLGLAPRSMPADLRIVLDCANGSGGVRRRREILAATGATVEVIHDEPDGININVRLRRDRPGRPRGRRSSRAAPTSGFALDGDADRLVAVDADGDGRRRRPGARHPRARPARARRARRRRARGRRVLSNGGLQDGRRGGRRADRAHARRRQVHPRGRCSVSGAGLGGEKSGHVIMLEHTHVGRRHRDRARGAGRHGAGAAARSPSWPHEIPLLPQQQRAVPVRHKDQWEADRALRGRRRAPHGAGWPAGRVLVRPSGTEPALRVMVEGRDAARRGRAGRRRSRPSPGSV